MIWWQVRFTASAFILARAWTRLIAGGLYLGR